MRRLKDTRFSSEAKHWTMAMFVLELHWLKILPKDIRTIIEESMKIYCDNKIAINFSNNMMLYDKKKHVDIDRHFIRENMDS